MIAHRALTGDSTSMTPASMRKSDSAPALRELDEADEVPVAPAAAALTTTARNRGEFDLEAPINAISASPDGSLLIAAGRDVMKIVSIVGDEFSLVKNLRSGRANLNFSSNDVKWHPMETHKNRIATSATNGAVILWNIQINASKQERVFSDHKRTVNRICWHNENPDLLLSGSQDGTMKIWDLREPDTAARFTFVGQSEAVRDVQFNPFYPNYFGAAFDNGTIQVWDMRKTNVCERNITAHQGLVNCIDWHPEDRSLIASGGRDRLIKVWDLNRPGKPVHNVQTISSVGRIRWRPGNKTHIASAGSVFDNGIQLWDLKRPYFPIATLLGHKDITAGFLWRHDGPDIVISASKDCRLLYHDLRKCYKLIRDLRSTGVSWSVTGRLAMLNDKINRYDDPPPAAPPLLTPLPTTPTKVEDRKLSTLLFGTAAQSVAAPRAALASIIPGTVTSAPAPPVPQEKGVTHIFDLKPLDSDFDEGQVLQYLAQNYRYSGGSLADICSHNAEIAKHVDRHQVAQTWLVLRLLYGEVMHAAARTTSESLEPAAAPLEPVVSPVPSSTAPPPPVAPPPPLMKSTDLSRPDPPSAPPPPVIRVASERQDQAASAPPVVRTLPAPTFPRWNHEATVRQMLEWYSLAGDVQTCVAISLVLGDKLKVEPEQLSKWIVAFLELLSRLQLWTASNEVIKACRDPNIRLVNTASTSVHTSCPLCLKPLFKKGYACESCKKVPSACSVCHLPVKGLYAWCQGCGHGGHLRHMDDWFAKNTACPVGCGHLCNFKAQRRKPAASPAGSV